MRRIVVSIFAMIMILGLICTAFAEPVKLEYKFKKGDVDKYKITMDMSMALPDMPGLGGGKSINMAMSMLMVQRVLDVSSDGSAHVKTFLGDVQVSGSPLPTKKQADQSVNVIMTITKDGRVLNVKGLDKAFSAGIPGMDMSQMMNQMGLLVILPCNPVDTGATWQQNIPSPFGGGKLDITSKLLSTGEPVWSESAAKIKQSYNGYFDLASMMKNIASSMGEKGKAGNAMSSMSGGLDFKGGLEYFFSPTKGKLLKSNGNIRATMNMNMPASAVKSGAPSSVSMTMNMNLAMTRTR